MAIAVEEVLGDTPRGVRAIVRHADQVLEIEIVGERTRLEAEIGKALIVELAFHGVRSSRIVPAGAPLTHGLFAADAGCVRIVGVVHNVIKMAPAPFLFDVYVASGPEYLSLDSDDLSGQRPEVGVVLEVVVTGLACFPTWT